jgi:predicted methyltransferase
LLLNKLIDTKETHLYTLDKTMKQTYRALTILLIINTSILTVETANANANIKTKTKAKTDIIHKASHHENRLQQDKIRDTARKPAEIVKLLDIKPGMKVLDYIAGGGYYSEFFARVPNNQGALYNVKGRLTNVI